MLFTEDIGKIGTEFLTPENCLWAFKNHQNVFYLLQGTRWTYNFSHAQSEIKLWAITGFLHFWALGLISKVTG